jgi:hypothetical protein
MAIISWENYADTATITNNSDGAEALSVQKLKTRQIGDVFRQTVSLTSPNEEVIIDFDLGSTMRTDLICILNHNMGGYAYTITWGTTPGGAEVKTATGTLWSGTTYHPNNEMLLMASSYNARYIRLAVAIPAAGSVDIGRVWIGLGWEYSNSMDFSVGIVDRSTKIKSRAGSSYVSDRQKLRELNIRAYGSNDTDFFGSSSDADMKSFLTMDLAVGTSGEIVCLPMHATQQERQTTGVYGTIVNNGPISVRDRGSAGLLTEKTFKIEEDRG